MTLNSRFEQSLHPNERRVRKLLVSVMTIGRAVPIGGSLVEASSTKHHGELIHSYHRALA